MSFGLQDNLLETLSLNTSKDISTRKTGYPISYWDWRGLLGVQGDVEFSTKKSVGGETSQVNSASIIGKSRR